MDDLSRITDIIYEAAEDPNLWLTVFEYLSSKKKAYINSNGTDKELEFFECLNSTGGEQLGLVPFNQHLSELLPHFQRSMRIGVKLSFNESQYQSFQNVVDELPLGLVNINIEGAILASNKIARQLFAGKISVTNDNGIFKIKNSQDNEKFYDQVQQLASNNTYSNPVTYSLVHGDSGAKLSILIAQNLNGLGQPLNTCNLFIATPYSHRISSPELLRYIYNLTVTEGKTAFLLANGLSVEEICLELCVTHHTVRAHLKSIYRKTETSSQSELISLILQGPTLYSKKMSRYQALLVSADTARKSSKLQIFTLRDKRRISFACYGPPNAKHHVVFLHSLFGSRSQCPGHSNLLELYGVRLIIPDRPGYGLSCQSVNHSLVGYANDIRELMEHLRVEKAHFIGYSAGGYYCCAIANYMPDLFSGMTLVSSIAPYDNLQQIKDIEPLMVRMVFALSLCAPSVVDAIRKIFVKSVAKNRDSFIKMLLQHLSLDDRFLAHHSGALENLLLCFVEAVENGTYGVEKDSEMISQAWPFQLSKIDVHAQIWHGDQDCSTPWSLAKNLCRIPNHTLHLLPGYGHFFIYEQWEAILKQACHVSSLVPEDGGFHPKATSSV